MLLLQYCTSRCGASMVSRDRIPNSHKSVGDSRDSGGVECARANDGYTQCNNILPYDSKDYIFIEILLLPHTQQSLLKTIEVHIVSGKSFCDEQEGEQ